MVGKSIETQILDSIRKSGRGRMIFASDFVRYGEKKSINKALERMSDDEKIIR